jgi:hypothetical protein
MILPHSAHLGISAYLKFLQFSACKMGYEVALLSLRPAGQPASQPAGQPASRPPTYINWYISATNSQTLPKFET